MGKVVILDMGPEDVLVFKTAHAWDPGEINEWVDNMRRLLDCEILLIDPDIDIERFSAKQVRAVRRLFADPKFKAGMEQVARALRPLVPVQTSGPIKLCGMPSTLDPATVCNLMLDPLDRCPNHGNEWEAGKKGARK